MKKFTILALVLVLTFSLAACGRRDEMPTETTPSATQIPTEQVTIPTIVPTMGTNIPDPEVDTSMPDLMDPTGEAGGQTGNSSTGDSQGNSGSTSGSTGMGD